MYFSREASRIEKSFHFVHVRALITRKILPSRNAQCNTEESHQLEFLPTRVQKSRGGGGGGT